MRSKHQQTMAKRAREQAVRERRALKAEKKQERKDAAAAAAVGEAEGAESEEIEIQPADAAGDDPGDA